MLGVERSLNRYARLAGLLYLTIIVTSILSLIFVESRLVVAGDWAATTERITANEVLYRAGLAYEMVMFASVIALAWALFVLLRGIDRNRALLALLWRMAEAFVGIVTMLLGVLVVLLVHGQGTHATFEPEQLHSLIDVLVTARGIGSDVTIFFLSLGTIMYCRLLYTSRYVPRLLSGLGIAAFVLMAGGAVVNLLLPQYKDLVMVGWGPGIVFEVAIGVWLLVKGVRTAPAGVAAAEATAGTVSR